MQRRNSKVDMKVPIFRDIHTNVETATNDSPFPGFIYLDSPTFGLGMSCLQCTFSTKNLSNARYIYDQLHAMSPIFMALTAGTPFHKGKLASWDCRWKVISGCLDDRTEDERSPESIKYVTSRHGAIQTYASERKQNL